VDINRWNGYLKPLITFCYLLLNVWDQIDKQNEDNEDDEEDSCAVSELTEFEEL
jgi:hypothetical protein